MANYDYVSRFFRPAFGDDRITNPGSTATNQFYGRAGIAAGTSVVSTTRIKAAGQSIIAVTIENASPVASAGAATAYGVTAITSGVSFTIGAVASTAATGSFWAHWTLRNPR